MSIETAQKHGVNEMIPDRAALWSALAEDTALPVMIVDTAGVVEYVNTAATNLLGASVISRKLSDIHPEGFAKERLEHIEEAVSTNQALTVDAIQGGRLMRTTIRPIAANGHASRRALLVMRPAPGTGVGGVSPNANAPSSVRRAKADEASPLAQLTPREIEILSHIGRGLSTAEIAKALGRSVKTVEWHRVSLGEKLGVTNRVELARIAISAGLVSLDTK